MMDIDKAFDEFVEFPDGSEDLNPYVHEFAAALMKALKAEVERFTEEV